MRPRPLLALAATSGATITFSSASPSSGTKSSPTAVPRVREGRKGPSPSRSSIYSASFTSRPISDDLLSVISNCESDISCAGVSLDPNGTIADGSRLYRHSYVGLYRTERTYEARKDGFTFHRGRIFPSHERDEVIEVRDDLTVAQAKEKCASDPKCVAFTYPVWSLSDIARPPNVTFVSEVRIFLPLRSDEWRTYISNGPSGDGKIANPSQLSYDPRVVENPYRTCCDREDVPTMEEIAKADTLERISCDISREEFFLKYELPRKPVMLVGCEKGWPATDGRWEPKVLAHRFTNGTRWRARIGGDKRLKHEDYNHNVRWGDIAEAMLTDKPYYLFDQLFDPEAKVIDEEYEDPLPVRGGDLYRKLPYFNGPLRWFCVGPEGTGTKGHMDPYGTDAWNTLIKGNKWWIIYPEGFTDEDVIDCDESCSVKIPLVGHWYGSIGINAARSEYVPGGFGRHVLQRAGETIYIPDGLVHSVYNPTSTIAITRNYASAANLDEVWMETVTSGDPLKWRMMYYHTLNREQRKRVRRSTYWPPRRWEKREDEICHDEDEEDEMVWFPMFEYEPEWLPEVGELVESRIVERRDVYWRVGTITEINDSKYSLRFDDGEIGNEYHQSWLRRLPKEGDVVEAQYDGVYNEWYRATITAVHEDGSFDVEYADGEKDEGLQREHIREFFPFHEYEMVQVMWEGPKDDEQSYWVDCMIMAVNEDGTVDVRHFDGEEIKGLSPLTVRRLRWEFEKGDDVIARTETDGEVDWFEGMVTKVHENGRYDILFNDGDDVECLGWRSIRFQWAQEEEEEEED